MRGRFFKGIDNPLVVIHRVGIYFRIPNRLIAENGNAVDYRRHFAIAPAGIKPDPAAVQISPDRNRFLKRFRAVCILAIQHLKRAVINILHKMKIKTALAAGGVNLFDIFIDFSAAADCQPKPAP